MILSHFNKCDAFNSCPDDNLSLSSKTKRKKKAEKFVFTQSDIMAMDRHARKHFTLCQLIQTELNRKYCLLNILFRC